MVTMSPFHTVSEINGRFSYPFHLALPLRGVKRKGYSMVFHMMVFPWNFVIPVEFNKLEVCSDDELQLETAMSQKQFSDDNRFRLP